MKPYMYLREVFTYTEAFGLNITTPRKFEIEITVSANCNRGFIKTRYVLTI